MAYPRMREAPAPESGVQQETGPSKELPVKVAVNVRPLLGNEEARGDFECVQPSPGYERWKWSGIVNLRPRERRERRKEKHA